MVLCLNSPQSGSNENTQTHVLWNDEQEEREETKNKNPTTAAASSSSCQTTESYAEAITASIQLAMKNKKSTKPNNFWPSFFPFRITDDDADVSSVDLNTEFSHFRTKQNSWEYEENTERIAAVARTVGVAVTGGTMVIVGVPLEALTGPVPGPGLMVVYGGIRVLSTEFEAAQDLENQIQAKFPFLQDLEKDMQSRLPSFLKRRFGVTEEEEEEEEEFEEDSSDAEKEDGNEEELCPAGENVKTIDSS